MEESMSSKTYTSSENEYTLRNLGGGFAVADSAYRHKAFEAKKAGDLELSKIYRMKAAEDRKSSHACYAGAVAIQELDRLKALLAEKGIVLEPKDENATESVLLRF
jgi:hypothetical protein